MSGPAPSDSDSLIISVVEADSFYCQITNLKPQTTYYVRAYAANKYGAYNGAKVEKFTTTDGLPVLNNAKFRLVKVDYTSAEFSYAITSEGDSAVIASGLCFSTKPNPTIEEGDTVICGRGIGEFTGTIQDMKQQQAYYVRAFAINKAGVRYTEGEGLHTIPVSELPTVETAEVTDIQSGSASVGGEVLAEGASPVTESGVCWGKLPDPTLEDSEGSLAISSGTQAFRGTLNQLRGDRSYYLRAYATNANGTSYGKTVSFKTPAIFGSLIAFEGGYRIPGSVAYCTLSGSVGFLLGGDMGREYTDELWVFNVSEQNWLDRKSQPEKLSGQSVFSIGLGVWAFGGWDNERKISDSLYVYSISGNYWDSEDSDRETRPKGRYRAVTCRVDDHAYLIGGRRENNPLKEVWSYTPSTTSWEKKGDFPVEQYGGIVVAVNGRVYAGLGIISKDDVSPKYTNKFWSADEGLDSWSEESDFPGEQCQGAVAWGNDVYAVDNEGTIWRYDTDTHAWSERSRLDTDRRTVHCIYALNDLIYIGLGSGSGALITYDPSWDN